MELVLAGCSRARDRVSGGDGRDRRGRADPVARRVRSAWSWPAFPRAGRPSSRSPPPRSCRCSWGSARSRASLPRHASMALELGGATVGLFLRCASSPIPPAARAGCVGRRRSGGPRSCVRSPAPIRSCWLLPARGHRAAAHLAARIAAGRDIGTGVLPARDSAEPHLRLLSSPTRAGAALRARQLCSLALERRRVRVHHSAWSPRASHPPDISKSMQREIAKLGAGSIATPTGYLAFVFIFFILAVSLFVCAQIARRAPRGSRRATGDAARAAGQPPQLARRAACAGGRGGACAISLAARAAQLGGRGLAGLGISLARMLEAGANCLPVALLFLGIAALAYAIVPRASAGISYGLVTVAFLWQLFGLAAQRTRNGWCRRHRSRMSGSCPRSLFAPAPPSSCSGSQRYRRSAARVVLPAAAI